jgi:hypothetical protein
MVALEMRFPKQLEQRSPEHQREMKCFFREKLVWAATVYAERGWVVWYRVTEYRSGAVEGPFRAEEACRAGLETFGRMGGSPVVSVGKSIPA